MRKYTAHIFFVLFLVAAIFAATTYQQLAAFKRNPQEAAAAESKALVAQVSKIIVLPVDETPTVATVNNTEPLKDQPFFANAKVGYKVLIYTGAKKAILFDPVGNKIVEVAPINIGDSTKKTTTPAPKK